MASIEEAILQYPREDLSSRVTPLDHLKHLSRELDFDLHIKRDDLTDLALGGDKPRKLEYEIAKVRGQGVDVLVTCGSAQSNHARLTTAAARKLGMKCAVVLSRDKWQSTQGNLLTVYLMGAQVTMVDVEDHWDLERHALELCETLKSQGHRPHYIPVSGTTPQSCLGYVRGALELIQQLEARKICPDAIYTPFGTGGIFCSMLLTSREKGIQCPIIGISVNRREQECREYLDRWWKPVCELLQCDPNRPRGTYEIHDQFIGAEYGAPTEACFDAMMAMASTEGIILDPVYSGKVFSGLLDHAKAGRWNTGKQIVFLHSGGVPALFAYHNQIESHLKKRGVVIAP